MLGSLKNYTSLKALISHCIGRSKTENAQNQILLRQKDAPFNGGSTQPHFADRLWRETQKIRILSFRSYTMSFSQVSSDTMLDFYHLSQYYLSIFNLENNKHNNQTQETMNTMFFIGETINGENPATSSEIESTPKVKPQNSKMISRQQQPLSFQPQQLLLSQLCTTTKCE